MNSDTLSIIFAGHVDSSKCFAKGTKVMRYDGSPINVEDVDKGMLLMGDDSMPRKVLETHSGIAQLYRIIPENGQEYVVNGEHIMVLKYSDEKYGVVDISVKEFMNLGEEYQRMLMWHRVGVDFPHQSLESELDPHSVGVEIKNRMQSKGAIPEGIPDGYKFSSRDNRFRLLSGLINLDSSNSLIVNNKNKKLIDDIKFLVGSLGFSVGCVNGVRADCSELIIGNKINVGIRIEMADIDEYYGFSLDGNHRFLGEDFSVLHNSTTIGVLVSGELDDGNGSARLKIAKHPHEMESGRTSDISTKTIKLESGKEVSFVDLCGHEKYLRSTIFGITGYFPDYGVLTIAVRRGIQEMTKEHLGILLLLRIPFIINIARIDLIDKTNTKMYDNLIKSIKKILKKYRCRAEVINSLEELDLDGDELRNREELAIEKTEGLAEMIHQNPNLVPLITTSNKTGYFIRPFKNLLTSLKPRELWGELPDGGSIFYIDCKFTPKGIGLVVSGLLRGAPIRVGDEMQIGPINKEFIKIRVWSIHDDNRNHINELTHKHRGCLAFKIVNRKVNFGKQSIKRGHLVINNRVNLDFVCIQFNAKIKILNHSTTIGRGYIPFINCGTVNQSARLVIKEGEYLKIGSEDEVTFRFVKHAEYIEPGTQLVLREGKTRGIGYITATLSIKNDPTI